METNYFPLFTHKRGYHLTLDLGLGPLYGPEP